MKNFSDTIRNRTRDLPACSAVPQPAATPRAPVLTFTLASKGSQCAENISIAFFLVMISKTPIFDRSFR